VDHQSGTPDAGGVVLAVLAWIRTAIVVAGLIAGVVLLIQKFSRRA